MDDQYRTKPRNVIAYFWDGDIIESMDLPPVPDALRQRFPLRIKMTCVGKKTHGGDLQWLPQVFNGNLSVYIRPRSWVVLHPNAQMFVFTDEEFHQHYEKVPLLKTVCVEHNHSPYCDQYCVSIPHQHVISE